MKTSPFAELANGVSALVSISLAKPVRVANHIYLPPKVTSGRLTAPAEHHVFTSINAAKLYNRTELGGRAITSDHAPSYDKHARTVDQSSWCKAKGKSTTRPAIPRFADRSYITRELKGAPKFRAEPRIKFRAEPKVLRKLKVQR